MMRITRTAVLLALAFGLEGCGPGAASSAAPKSPPPATVSKLGKETDLATITLTKEAVARLGVKTAVVAMKLLPRTRQYAGEVVAPPGRTLTLAAPFTAIVRSPEGGKIREPGEEVPMGSMVLGLEPVLAPESGIALEAARVNRATARLAIDRARLETEGTIQRAEAELSASEPLLARAEKLAASEAGSKKAVDEARARVISAKAALESARLLADGLRRLDLPETESGPPPVLGLHAPIGGRCRAVFAAAGSIVPAGAALFEIQDLSSVWVRVPVPVSDLATLDLAGGAIVRIQDDHGVQRTATLLTDRPPSADFAAGTADVHFGLEDGKSLRPGQRLPVTLGTNGAAETLAVPWASVLHDIHGGTWVYEATAPETFVRRRVTVLRVQGDLAALASGPPAGTPVVTDGAAEIFGTEFGIGK